jgi:hypothetical protein
MAVAHPLRQHDAVSAVGSVTAAFAGPARRSDRRVKPTTEGLTMFERFRRHPGAEMRRIGTAVLTERHTFTNGYECAAWWQDVTCEPQTVELRSNGYWVCARFEGTVTDAYFGSLYCGVPIGTYDKSRDVGGPGAYTVQMYDYDVAEAIAKRDGVIGNVQVTLDDDVRVSAEVKPDIRKTPFYGFEIQREAAA